jgi:TolB protein
VVVMRRVAVVALIVLALAPSVEAAMPGANGKIAFERSFSTGSCFLRPFTINPDGSGEAPFFADPLKGGSGVDWAPDGSRLALNACPEAGISVSDADGSDETVIIPGFAGGPSWSPSGAEIAYTARRELEGEQCGPHVNLFVTSADGATTRRLTSDTFIESSPEWSPRGDWILYLSDWMGFDPDEGCKPVPFGGSMYLIRPDGTDLREHGYLQDWDWSPDGAHIASRSNGGDIIVGSTNLTNTPNDFEAEPAWSPDGKQIAYSRAGDIWVMNADGSDQHQVTFSPQADRRPDWQPLPVRYVRPRGATPTRVPLVPAFKPCASPNSTHGAPLSFGSCDPPAPASASAFIGGNDGILAARSIGSVKVRAQPGTVGAPDDAEVQLSLSITNVMNPDRSDYTGELRLELPLRLTDMFNGWPVDSGTVTDTSIFATVPCTPTADSNTGSTCTLSTTADAIAMHTVMEGWKAIWQLGQIKVHDGGADGDADTPGDNELFAVQGLFVP